MPHAPTVEIFFKASLDACRKVYELLESPLVDEDLKGTTIGEGGDISLVIDVKAEKIFFDYFGSFASVYSEEYGHFGEGDYKVILDPIDGSDNFASNFPYYGASMALEYQGKTVAGLVCNLSNGDIFYRLEKSSAKKASLHHDKVHDLVRNSHAKVGIFEKSALFPKIIGKLIQNKLKFRSPGAVALSLAYAFDAKYMIFLGSKRSFDVEAGLYITEELCRYETDKAILIAQDEDTLAEIKAIVLEEII